MLKYMLRRILQMIPVLIIITIITFLFVNASGDPTAMLLPPEATFEDREILREALGLNEPLYVQYWIFITNALHGDFGTSFRYGTSAMGVVMEKIPATVQLASVSLLCSILVAIPLGILSAHTKDSPLDLVVSGLSSLGRSMPSFWVGIMLILLFGVTLKVLPVSGRGTWLNLVLPCATLTINTATHIVPLVSSGMLEIMQQDYIRTARSRGIGTRSLICHHALRNALLPVVSYIGPLAAALMTGSFIVETIFAIPGLGRHFVTSIYNRDYTVILGITIFYSFLIMMMNLLIDVIYPLLDPRITMDGKKEG